MIFVRSGSEGDDRSLCNSACGRNQAVSKVGRELSSYNDFFLEEAHHRFYREVRMKEIFDALRDVFEIQADAEITMEANPGTVTKENLQAYRACGINRISLDCSRSMIRN